MAWTNVAKPNTSSYTNVSHGQAYYDDATVSYDDSNTYYDGMNPGAWSNVSKPGSSSWTSVAKPT